MENKNAIDIVNSRPKRVMRSQNLLRNNRLTKRQFQSLMKKAAVELGINNDKALPILDTTTDRQFKEITDMLDLILVNLENQTAIEVVDQFKEITKGRRLKKKDKLNVLGWLLNPHATKKPMCILDNKEKIKGSRKIGLKTKGDKGVLDRPFRVLPDPQFVKEISFGQTRTKFDAFDKLDEDTKIKWARYAQSVSGVKLSANSLLHLCQTYPDFSSAIFNTESDAIIVAMKYACKMCQIPQFKGNFAKPYWISHRIDKFNETMTNEEFNTFYEIVGDYLGLSKKTLKILAEGEAISKIIPTLKNMKLYKEYQTWFKEEYEKFNVVNENKCLKKAYELIMRKNNA